MDKKILIWKGFQTPPTNYIWIRESFAGDYNGVFAWDGNSWEKIEGEVGPVEPGEIQPTTDPNKVYGTDQFGNLLYIDYGPEFANNPNAIVTMQMLY